MEEFVQIMTPCSTKPPEMLLKHAEKMRLGEHSLLLINVF